MAADPQEAVTLWEAIKFLAPLVGTGGATAIAVAYFGSRRPREERRAESEAPKPEQIGIQALLADHMAMQNFTAEIRRLADAAEDISKVGSRLADMMDISRAVERLARHRDE